MKIVYVYDCLDDCSYRFIDIHFTGTSVNAMITIQKGRDTDTSSY